MGSISGSRASSSPERLTTRVRLHAAPLRVGAAWLAAALASASLGCSEDDAGPLTPYGGSAGVGGQTSRAGSGGAPSGGAPAGGTSAGGSSAGGTGSAQTPLGTFDFADDIQAWVFVYAEPPTLIDTTTPPTGDAGVDAGPLPAPPTGVATAAHDATVGDPLGNAGSVLLALPFSAPAQKIEFEGNVATGAAGDVGINLAGRSISARIRVDSGLTADASNPAGVKIYVKTGATSLYADSGYINLLPVSDWQTVTWVNVSNPTYTATPGTHTPTDVRQIGLEFDTGSAGIYTAATIHLDSVAY
jgi:hypothetical protein